MTATVATLRTDAYRRHRFRSMAVAIELLLESDDDLEDVFADAEAEFRRLDDVFSRFDPRSELSRLNRLGRLRCGPDLRAVLTVALAAREETGGRFDPTVHDALVAAGYDRTFAELPPWRNGPEPLPRPCGGDVDVGSARGEVSLAPGARVDLGGIVKGYAAERVCDLLAPYGPCLVNAAGDIAVRGAPAAGSWTVLVDTPGGPVVLGVERGGIATSGRDFRRWWRNGRELHHLIDPATGAPSRSDLVTVTVVGHDAVDAEIWAKALFLAGSAAAAHEADRLGIPCLLVADSGRVVRAGGLA